MPGNILKIEHDRPSCTGLRTFATFMYNPEYDLMLVNYIRIPAVATVVATALGSWTLCYVHGWGLRLLTTSELKKYALPV